MDLPTRDRYRHVVEKIAKSSRLSESKVARKAIQLAHESAARNGSDNRAAHVGFYLIDKGLAQLEQLAEVRLPVSETLRNLSSRFPLLLYIGTIMLMTTIVAGSLLAKAHPLPRMDFSKGIPPELRTLVVIPTMLTSTQNIEDMIEALEVRFLANRDDSLHFALLTDFRDAREEMLPEDGPLLLLARQRIEELNEKYKGLTNDSFFLFHRPRRWNPRDRTWMGYERKRGELVELNAFLR